MQAAAQVLYYVLPNFHNFNTITAAAHGESIPVSLIWQNTAYAALYVVLCWSQLRRSFPAVI